MAHRRINEAGRALIQSFESLRLTAYRCQAGVWTIGWGHTGLVNGKPIAAGVTITQAQAVALLFSDLDAFERAVATLAPTATDNQFAAMASLAFNVGTGAFGGSTVLRQHRAGRYAAAANAFRSWVHVRQAGKLKVSAGLQRRREVERTLYLTP